ncbi:MAG: phosphoribosylanthranilate isomerase [Elusimicrobiota bacterium]|nr:phosphoribosylanthranilate isomerase [Elusimicrobiota bacterium]
MTLIKICGITSRKDLKLVMAAGADLLGFNIYPKSKRYIKRKMLADFLKNEKVKEKAVIVSVNEPVESLCGILKHNRPAYVQLHGDETAGYAATLKEKCPGIKIIKKVNIEEREIFKDILEYADYLLCDTASNGFGGSGKKFNWEKLNDIDPQVRKKLFAAGGINPDNVGEVLKYNILGVDAATGTEKRPGKKDKKKVFEIVRKVRES